MTTPITGTISLSDVRSELGASGAISFGDTLVRRLSNQMSGTVSLGNTRAAKYLNSTVTNQNALTNFFSSSSTVTSYKVLIGTSGVIGATSGNTALTIGQFASGSTIVVNNYGSINAYGGVGGTAGVGGAGGDAIYASYPNQTVTINNQSGAVIRGGGGGGGKGGTGGAGTAISYVYNGSNKWQIQSLTCNYFPNSSRRIYAYWNGSLVINQNHCSEGITMSNPYGGYYIGAYQTCYAVTDCGGDPGGDSQSEYAIGGSTATSGGAGGAGGRGQGYDGANAGGSAGSAGGTNAGAGGTGGAGGLYGAAGSTGSTGASGNAGAGSAGSTGGASGRYLVKGANSVTLNNSGTVAGGLA